MTGCLLAGEGPVLGNRYEKAVYKVSWNVVHGQKDGRRPSAVSGKKKERIQLCLTKRVGRLQIIFDTFRRVSESEVA
jgi:hypothetical protein